MNDTYTNPDRSSVSMLRYQLENFRENDIILALCFSQEDGSFIGPTCKNSADFVEDILYGYMGRTLYVGSVLDYHL